MRRAFSPSHRGRGWRRVGGETRFWQGWLCASLTGCLAFASIRSEAAEPAVRGEAETVSITGLEVGGGGHRVVIRTSGTPRYSVFELTQPRRILVDIQDARIDPAVNAAPASGPFLKGVQPRVFSDEAGTPTARVELTLAKPTKHRVRQTDGRIVVELSHSAQSPDASGPTRLGRLKVKKDGSRTLIAGPVKGTPLSSEHVRMQTLSDPPRLVIDLSGARIAPKWQRLSVNAHGVERARAANRPDGARIVLDLEATSDFPEVAVDVVGNELQVGLESNEVAEGPPSLDEPSPAVAARPRPAVGEGESGAVARPSSPPVSTNPVEGSGPPTAVDAKQIRPDGPGSTARREPASPPSRQTKAAEPAFVRRQKAAPGSTPSASSGAARGGASLNSRQDSNALVKNVRFEPKDGFYRLTVDLDRPVRKEHVVRFGSEAKPALRLDRVQIPETLERTMDVSALAGEALTSISSYREAGGLILSARIGDRTEHRYWVKGSRLMWDFRSSKPRVAVYDEESTASFDSGLTQATGRLVPGQQRYNGRRISLDLKDADIQNVLRLLADVSKLNIVASDDVNGKITIKLRNVPWDQALDIILRAKQLDKTRNGNIIRVAPLSVLRKEEELRLARQEAQVRLEPLTVRLIPVSYAVASDVSPQVQALLTERGKVNVDVRTNVLIVEDIADVLSKVERLVRTLDTQTPQVLIEARIVEARSNFSRELGIQWGGNASFSQNFGNQTGLSFPSNIRIAGGADDVQNQVVEGVLPPENPNANYAVNLPAVVGSGAGGALGFVFGSLNGGTMLNLRLSAAEAVGKIKIVSAPKVVTLDNKEAKILSGERVPITVITANGPTTRFVDANIELRVVPHVTQEGSILMQIRAKKNELSDRVDNLGVPGILTKEAETQMIVQDGDTAVLGGLYRRTSQENEAYVPWLGRIPILGWLFKSTSRQDARDETLIFISPRIVNRSAALIAPE